MYIAHLLIELSLCEKTIVIISIYLTNTHLPKHASSKNSWPQFSPSNNKTVVYTNIIAQNILHSSLFIILKKIKNKIKISTKLMSAK